MTIEVGKSSSYEKVIKMSDVEDFARITGDFNPIHLDEIVAKQSIFGDRIVHGILVTGMISKIIGMDMPGEGTIYMEQNVKFRKPVKIGEKLKAVVTVIEIINVDRGIYKLDTTVYNEKIEKVIEGYAIVKV